MGQDGISLHLWGHRCGLLSFHLHNSRCRSQCQHFAAAGSHLFRKRGCPGNTRKQGVLGPEPPQAPPPCGIDVPPHVRLPRARVLPSQPHDGDRFDLPRPVADAAALTPLAARDDGRPEVLRRPHRQDRAARGAADADLLPGSTKCAPSRRLLIRRRIEIPSPVLLIEHQNPLPQLPLHARPSRTAWENAVSSAAISSITFRSAAVSSVPWLHHVQQQPQQCLRAGIERRDSCA